MATQEQYTQAVLKAQLVTAQTGNELILCEMGGCDADWSQALCQYRQIQGALFCLTIGDYISDTAVYFYNVMLAIVGLKYTADVVPDPNAQPPEGITIIIDGTQSVDYNYTNADLILDVDTGNWYLDYKDEFNMPILTKPYNITDTISTHTGPINAYYENDLSWDFPRIYGFPPNTTAQIITIHTL